MAEPIRVAVYYNEPESYLPAAGTAIDAKKRKELEQNETMRRETFNEFDDIISAITSLGYDTYFLNIADDLTIMLQDLAVNKPDVVFNFIELFRGQSKLEMNVAGVYELLGIPFTGSPSLGLGNCLNKVVAKMLLYQNQVPTPAYAAFRQGEIPGTCNLCFPLIVKPAMEDGSGGIDNNSIVHTLEELRARVAYIHSDFKQSALVEEYIVGRELNVAILQEEETVVLPISEIDFSAMPPNLERIVSYQAKWDPAHEAYHKTVPVCPAVLPASVEADVKATALLAYQVMGMRDYARVDIRLSAEGKPFVLEVNPNPDLHPDAGFMRSAGAAGISYQQALRRIIEAARKRGGERFYHYAAVPVAGS